MKVALAHTERQKEMNDMLHIHLHNHTQLLLPYLEQSEAGKDMGVDRLQVASNEHPEEQYRELDDAHKQVLVLV
jgi:hypothetical protein